MNVVKDSFVNYYSNLLGKPHLSHYKGHDRIKHLITRKLTESQRLSMIHDVSNSEIKDTLWEMNPKKALA